MSEIRRRGDSVHGTAIIGATGPKIDVCVKAKTYKIVEKVNKSLLDTENLKNVKRPYNESDVLRWASKIKQTFNHKTIMESLIQLDAQLKEVEYNAYDLYKS